TQDLARLPAAGQVVRGRLRAHRVALRVVGDLLEVAELLRVAVAREHLDQRLAVGVVLRGGELLVPARSRRRVEAPRVAVRDDDRVEAPLRELLEQRLRRVCRLAAVRGKLAGVDAVRTDRGGSQLLLESPEIEVALAVRPVEQREPDALPERRTLAQAT